MEFQELFNKILPDLKTEHQGYFFEIKKQFEKLDIRLGQCQEDLKIIGVAMDKADDEEYDIYEARIRELKGKVAKGNEYENLIKELDQKRKSQIGHRIAITTKYNKALEALSEIYNINRQNNYANINNLRERMMNISNNILKVCDNCKCPDHQCDC